MKDDDDFTKNISTKHLVYENVKRPLISLVYLENEKIRSGFLKMESSTLGYLSR
jgi:hypothetical protein